MSQRLLGRLRLFGLCLLCLLGSVMAVNTYGQAQFRRDGLVFSTRIKLLMPGETRLSLPPLGVVSASTHRAPVQVQLELRGLNTPFLDALGSDPDAADRVLTNTTDQARRALILTMIAALALAGLGAIIVMLLVSRLRGRNLPAAAILGVLFCAALLGWTALDYDVSAINQPRYEGLLETAPWIMSLLTDSFDGWDGWQRLGEGFEVMAKNLSRLEKGPASPMSDLQADLRVLHVSDIHNNTAAYKLIQSLVDSFAVDLVIDTGDLTDYGTEFETGLTALISELGIPYVFVPGNHDSPAVIKSLRRLWNVRVVDGRVITVAGLKILGMPDPSAVAEGKLTTDADDLRKAGEELAALWRQAATKPDLVVTHDPEMIEPLIGSAPVLLHGHTHRASLVLNQGTLVEDAGTTGGAGIRGLIKADNPPCTVYLQYWRKNPAGRLEPVAVDAITIDESNGTLHAARTVIEQDSLLEQGLP